MAFIERAVEATNRQEHQQELNEAVQKTLSISHVEDYVSELSQVLPSSEIKKSIIEEGNRLVIKVDWKKEEEQNTNRIFLSVRENTIGFGGNPDSFVRLNGSDLENTELVENALVKVVSNPLSLSSVTS